MFWIFLIVLVAAAGLFKLGAYYVWIGILSIALKLGLLFGAGLGVYAVWKRLKRSS